MNNYMEKINRVKEYYFVCLLVGLVLRMVNVYSLIPSKYDGMLFTAFAGVGCVLLVSDFLVNLLKRKFPYDKFLVLFIIIIFISSIINRQFGLGANIKLIIWSCIYYFLAYQFAKENYINFPFFKKINLTLIFTWFILVIGSLITFFLNYGYQKVFTPRFRVRVGFLESRLFGFFNDPNYAATGSVIVIILCCYYLTKKCNNIWRTFFIVNIVLQYMYIVLSGSRTAEVVGYVVLGVTLFLLVMNSQKLNDYPILVRIIIGILCVVFSVLIIHFSIELLKKFFTHILESLKNIDKKIKIKEKVSSNSNATLVRKDVADSDDISNLRFSIWKSAWDLFKTSWLVGTSPKNMVAYAKDYLPNGFIAQNGFAVHNSYLYVLASTGVTGAITFFSFCVKSFINVVRKLPFNRPLAENYMYPYFLVVLSYAVFGAINSEFVLMHTVGSLVFWLFLGRLVGKGDEKENA